MLPMFGSLGVPELIFIFFLALVIFGPRKLPEIGRTIGRGLSEFRKASTDLKRSINAEMIEEEMRQSDPRKILNDSFADSSTGDSDGDSDDDPGDSGAGDDDDETAPADPAPPGSVPRSADTETP